MLSKSTEYAIRALVFVQLKNWEQKRPGVGEIAKEIEAPEAYTAKILQTLTKNKLMDSMKGRGGGFFFNDNQSNLTLYDVIHVVEGDACFHKCGFGLKQCNNDNPCPLHEQYKIVRDGFFEIVKTETIQSLSEKIKQGEAVLNRLKK
ncbi:RrF2 family transcriptional regulator [Mangrovibacterium diazotrophicum]|uniref:BadM/Rrf2 family transcriptional regulator n=1 Tax=Mangrovibacterium diazotrophicum TaxID=1261403 RepID=A0A419W2S1_9BACT|nr:Rrf2 family transcriptional regulator [Mangrovibacterium diazotrophicum]RKD89768.1 BadM/Rrf2 family transcriptional regulator [Mangrovibacterium diazotrophicum]